MCIYFLYFREILAPENLLRELFPDDLGEESPNPTNHYQLRQLELGNFSSLLNVLGYPYLWVQRICGLDFIPSQVSPILSNNFLKTTNYQNFLLER